MCITCVACSSCRYGYEMIPTYLLVLMTVTISYDVKNELIRDLLDGMNMLLPLTIHFLSLCVLCQILSHTTITFILLSVFASCAFETDFVC